MKLQSGLEPHHAAWLELHTNRDAQWLKDMLKAGFDVHHMDGNHNNNDPHNLVLIEHLDHMRLHGAVMGQGRLGFVSKKGKRRSSRYVTLPDGRVVPLLYRERHATVLRKFAKDPNSPEWDIRSGAKRNVTEKVSETPKSRREIFSEPYDRKLAYAEMWRAASKA